jgi:hypothetical protein
VRETNQSLFTFVTQPCATDRWLHLAQVAVKTGKLMFIFFRFQRNHRLLVHAGGFLFQIRLSFWLLFS